MTLDAWIDVLRDVMKEKPWAWTIFLVYILLTSYMIINLLIATICESTSHLVENRDKDEEQKNKTVDREMKKLQLSLYKMHEDICTKLGLDAKDSKRTSQLYLSDDESLESETMSDDVNIHATLRNTLVGGVSSNSKETTKPEGPLANFRFKCGLFINNDYIQLMIMALIISNSVMLVVATFDFENNSLQDTFDYIDKAFLAIFTFEITLQFIYQGWKMFTNAWHVFDLVVVAVSWPLDGLVAFRAFRVVRIVRLFPKFKSLREVIAIFVKSLQSLAGLLCMLLVIFYTFAVVFTALFKDENLSEGYEGFFDRLDKTLLTLFQIMTVCIESNYDIKSIHPYIHVSRTNLRNIHSFCII